MIPTFQHFKKPYFAKPIDEKSRTISHFYNLTSHKHKVGWLPYFWQRYHVIVNFTDMTFWKYRDRWEFLRHFHHQIKNPAAYLRSAELCFLKTSDSDAITPSIMSISSKFASKIYFASLYIHRIRIAKCIVFKVHSFKISSRWKRFFKKNVFSTDFLPKAQ